jgi:hypothetical protein
MDATEKMKRNGSMEHLRVVECYGQDTRYLAIARIYYEALDGRPLETVDFNEVTRAIYARMPETTPEEIGEALAWNELRKASYSLMMLATHSLN